MSVPIPTPSVFDVNALTTLKSQVKSDDPEALRAAAKQFEALFLQMVLKSMRDSVPREGLFDSDQTRMYESLLDQQLALNMSGKGSLGLAAMIEKQLARKNDDPAVFEKGLPLNPENPGFPLDAETMGRLDARTRSALLAAYSSVSKEFPESERSTVATDALAAYAGAQGNDAAGDFVARMRPHALAAERDTGIPAHFMVAQAALETGWGRAEPRRADGSPSFNLFGIKAGRSWKGGTVEASTLEYVDGQAQRQTERFRAYGSYADAFADYARLLTENPRYSVAVSSRDGAGFARALQNAGYASDPQYAAKLERIISSPALKGLKPG
ncbi:MAG: flagellar assembly peptidoglycan hydrolase FlgJ [Rhodocyclaceae bacterium]|nr:flagellar assembly peptidoglycan hydrolase FlgJ [Rhodocyclaceae bacterium]